MAIFSKTPGRARVPTAPDSARPGPSQPTAVPAATGLQPQPSASSASSTAAPRPLVFGPQALHTSPPPPGRAAPSQLQPTQSLQCELQKTLRVAEDLAGLVAKQLEAELAALPVHPAPKAPPKALVFTALRPWSRKFKIPIALMQVIRDEFLPLVNDVLAELGISIGDHVVAIRAGSARSLVPTWYDELTGDRRLISGRRMYDELTSGNRVPDVLVICGVTGFSVNPIVLVPVLQAMRNGLVIVIADDLHEVYNAAALLEALNLFFRFMNDSIPFSGPGGLGPGDDTHLVSQVCTADIVLGCFMNLNKLAPPANWARRVALAYLWRHIDSLVTRQGLIASVAVGVIGDLIVERSDGKRWPKQLRPLSELERAAGAVTVVEGGMSDEDEDEVEEEEEEKKEQERAEDLELAGPPEPARPDQTPTAPHPGSRAGMAAVPGPFAPGWGWCASCKDYRPLVTMGLQLVCRACKARGPNKGPAARPVTTLDTVSPAVARRAVGPCVNPACPYSKPTFAQLLVRDNTDGTSVLRCDPCHAYFRRFGKENPTVDPRRRPVMTSEELR